MKKRTILIVMALLLIPLAALSFTPKLWMRVSTGNITHAALQTKAGYFYGIIVHTDGTNAVLLNVYDNDDDSTGNKLVADWVVTTSSTDRTQSISYDPPIPYEDGIFTGVSTSGSVSYDIYFHASDD